MGLKTLGKALITGAKIGANGISKSVAALSVVISGYHLIQEAREIVSEHKSHPEPTSTTENQNT